MHDERFQGTWILYLKTWERRVGEAAVCCSLERSSRQVAALDGIGKGRWDGVEGAEALSVVLLTTFFGERGEEE